MKGFYLFSKKALENNFFKQTTMSVKEPITNRSMSSFKDSVLTLCHSQVLSFTRLQSISKLFLLHMLCGRFEYIFRKVFSSITFYNKHQLELCFKRFENITSPVTKEFIDEILSRGRTYEGSSPGPMLDLSPPRVKQRRSTSELNESTD